MRLRKLMIRFLRQNLAVAQLKDKKKIEKKVVKFEELLEKILKIIMKHLV